MHLMCAITGTGHFAGQCAPLAGTTVEYQWWAGWLAIATLLMLVVEGLPWHWVVALNYISSLCLFGTVLVNSKNRIELTIVILLSTMPTVAIVARQVDYQRRMSFLLRRALVLKRSEALDAVAAQVSVCCCRRRTAS